MGEKCRVEGRPAGDRIPEVTGIHRNRLWDITSDGPDSATSGSDIPEGHYDRPPEEEYSDVPTSGRPHVGHVAERLCSPIGQLEKAVVRLQRDMTDHRTELRLRTQTPATPTATATRPAGLERCAMFLLWEVGSCSNTMPELE